MCVYGGVGRPSPFKLGGKMGGAVGTLWLPLIECDEIFTRFVNIPPHASVDKTRGIHGATTGRTYQR